MITLIEALNYRCLRYVKRSLGPFHVLVGPNASGKTTFLDVIGFLQNVVYDGLDTAFESRTTDARNLFFKGQEDKLGLAVEARIPEELRKLTSQPDLDSVRYEIEIGFDESGYLPEFKAEMLLLKNDVEPKSVQRTFFPQSFDSPDSLLTRKRQRNILPVVNKLKEGNANFYNETKPRSNRGWIPSFKLGSRRSALKNLPADESAFPVAIWFRDYLMGGVQPILLESRKIKRPSPPGRPSVELSQDGSNLPWVIANLRKEATDKFKSWIEHLRTSLPDLVDISTVERLEDKHCYMVYEYAGGLKVPSWLVSDGTLRLTALTLPAYLPKFKGIYLIEEPENGIHPKAVVTAYDSLSSVYESQVLLATHSPTMLRSADLNSVLCFAKDDTGSTDIVLGSEHPVLKEWQGAVDLGTLLASGVLG